jgi:hypothetical protein
MLFPTQSLAYLDGAMADNDATKPFYTKLCLDPPSTLFVMDDPALTSITSSQTTAFLTSFFKRQPAPRIPTPSASTSSKLVTYQSPMRLLAWRLDRPARMILYTGTNPPTPSELDPLAPMQPHTFTKAVIEERTRRPAPSVIQQLTPTNISASTAVRASLAHYAKHVLAPYYERVTTTLPHDAAKRRWMQATSHTLEEAMACFIHPPPAHHNEVPLNGGRQWDKGHIDPRYAHTHAHSQATQGVGPPLFCRHFVGPHGLHQGGAMRILAWILFFGCIPSIRIRLQLYPHFRRRFGRELLTIIKAPLISQIPKQRLINPSLAPNLIPLSQPWCSRHIPVRTLLLFARGCTLLHFLLWFQLNSTRRHRRTLQPLLCIRLPFGF